MKRSLITDPAGEALAWLLSASENCLDSGSLDALLAAALDGVGGDSSIVLPDGFLLVFPASQALDVWRNIVHVYCLDEYRLRGTRVEGDYLVDIGSYIGVSVLRLASLFPGLPITAVEPNPKAARYLRLNIEGNGLAGRVHVLEAALWTRRGTAVLHVPRDWVNASLDAGYAAALGGSPLEQVKVQTLTLADLLRGGRAALIKMDAEGVEGPVLQNEAGAALEPKRAHTLVVELHERGTALAARRLLEDVGYTCSLHSLSGTIQWVLTCRPASSS